MPKRAPSSSAKATTAIGAIGANTKAKKTTGRGRRPGRGREELGGHVELRVYLDAYDRLVERPRTRGDDPRVAIVAQR